MKHLRASALRRTLDDPASLTAGDRDHLQQCARCKQAFAAAVADARQVALLLEGEPRPSVDPAPALQRLRDLGLGQLAAPLRTSWMRTLRSRGVRRPAVAAGVAGILMVGLVGTGVAGNFIKIFEPDRIVAVPVDRNTLNSLPDLTSYGHFSALVEPQESEAASLAEAAEQSGLELLFPAELPADAGAERIWVITEGKVAFTFDAASARAAGGADLPDELVDLDGSSLYLNVGPAVVQTFGGFQGEHLGPEGHSDAQPDVAGLLSQLPGLVIVQMAAPVVSSSGPTVQEYLDALLAIPGLPPELAEQIESIGDPSSSLPVPIPIDFAGARPVDINGSEGLLVGDNSGFGSGVVWEDGGVIRVVGAPMAEDDLLVIARSMAN